MISGKINGRWFTRWLTLHYYWKHFDWDFVHSIWLRQMNDSAGDGEGCCQVYRKQCTLHFNKISDEGKGCGAVCTAHAVSHTKITSYRTVLKTFDSLWKGRNCVFAINNHYQCNLGARFQTWIEISERDLEGKKFTKATKIPMPSFEGETNDDNGLWLYCVIASYVVPYGCSMDQHVYIHFLRKILRLKIHSQMLNCVIILHDNYCPHIATSVTTFFQEYRLEVLNHPPYSLDLSPLEYDLFPKLKEPLRRICFSDLSELSLVVTWEIQWLNKKQLVHGIEKLREHLRACILRSGNYIEIFCLK